MPLLIISALILAGLGYWEYTRLKAGLPILPFGSTPEQIVKSEVPSLSKEILDLYYNGRDPQAMHRAASELEKYGFFDAALLLHKRADQLSIPVAPASSIPGVPGTPATPGTPGLPTSNSLEELNKIVRSQIGQLDTEHGTLDRQIRLLTATSPQFLREWNDWLAVWRSFVLSAERLPNPGILIEDIGPYRQRFNEYRATFLREAGAPGVSTPVPSAPPSPGTQTANSNPVQVAVPFRGGSNLIRR